jgi:Amt family ammonium transporter
MEKCNGRVIWSFTSSVLVFAMIPGLALFEGGLVRSKNTVSIITQVLSGHCLLTVMWILFGFSLTFGKDAGHGFIGDLDHCVLRDVSLNTTAMNTFCDAPTTRGVQVLYELMFASITPLLMTGAYAERMRFRTFLLLTGLWELLVYYPVAHWIWAADGFMAKWGVVDYAGGIVVHTTSGVSALLLAWILGKRRDFRHFQHGGVPPSNVPLAAIGCAFLWMGWGGFNSGGADAGTMANLALLNTHVTAAVASLVWLTLSMQFGDTPRATAVMNGAIAGLACITPCAGFVSLQGAMPLGILAASGSYAFAHLLKRLRIDDVLEVSAVHGFTGVIGSLYTGVAATQTVSASPKLFGIQLAGVLLVGLYSAVMTLFITFLCRIALGPMRISEEDERLGLDLVEHQEVAYHEYQELLSTADGAHDDPILPEPCGGVTVQGLHESITVETSLPHDDSQKV